MVAEEVDKKQQHEAEGRVEQQLEDPTDGLGQYFQDQYRAHDQGGDEKYSG